MWVVLSDDWAATDYIRLRFDHNSKYRYCDTYDGREDLSYSSLT